MIRKGIVRDHHERFAGGLSGSKVRVMATENGCSRPEGGGHLVIGDDDQDPIPLIYHNSELMTAMQ